MFVILADKFFGNLGAALARQPPRLIAGLTQYLVTSFVIGRVHEFPPYPVILGWIIGPANLAKGFRPKCLSTNKYGA